MTDDPWAAFRVAPPQADPWAAFRTAAPAPAPPSAESATPPPDDKYRQAARVAVDQMNQTRAPGGSFARRLLQGATFNAADELLAGATTPFEMIRHGTFDPREGYRYAKAIQDVDLEDMRKQDGALGTAGEIAGGVLSGSGLARAGLTFGRMLAPNAGIAKRSAASAGDAAAFGTVAGGLEGNTAQERLGNALAGGAVGGAIGGAAPGVIAGAGAALSPVISNFRARINPEGFGRTQIARALLESSRTPTQIADDVALAAREGQDMFTVADAMGNPGQRMLSTVTRAPGPGRTEAVEFLDARQAGQARRIANALAEGFDAPQTAAQTRTRLTQARDDAADAAYDAVRQGAGPVDPTAAIARIDQTLRPGVTAIARPASGIADDSVEAALARVRSRLTDDRSTLTEFQAIQRARGDLADMIEVARRKGEDNKVRLLSQVRQELDTAMEAASHGYRAANADYSRRSGVIDAIDEGRQASRVGRAEDTVPAFQAMPPDRQAAFRVGYADPLIENAQGAAFGANKARPLTSEAFRAEGAAMAPNNAQMQRRVGRENTMFETRAHATGNSRTADNLADAGAMGVDPSLMANILLGNWSGAARSALTAGSNMMTGNTPAVREEVGRLLMMRGGNVTPAQLQTILQEAVDRVQLNQAIAAQLGRGAAGGLAIAPSAGQKP